MLTLECGKDARESQIAAGQLRAKEEGKEGELGEEWERKRETDKRELFSLSGTTVCLSSIIHCDLGPFQGAQLLSYYKYLLT